MAHWLIVVDDAEYERQRMYAADSVPLPLTVPGPTDDDAVLLAADGVLFGAGTVHDGRVVYTHRLLDEPPALDAPVTGRIDEAAWTALRALVPDSAAVTAPLRDYLVSVPISVEATSPAEAARLYWAYVRELGPAELPAFVSPYGDELAMRAYVLGEVHEMDPEEEDEDEEDEG